MQKGRSLLVEETTQQEGWFVGSNNQGGADLWSDGRTLVQGRGHLALRMC